MDKKKPRLIYYILLPEENESTNKPNIESKGTKKAIK